MTIYSVAADLSITGSHAPEPVIADEALTYTLTVANTGPGDATDVVVVNSLTQAAVLGSATATQGSCAGGTTVTCNLGSLPADGLATVTITVMPLAPTWITNTASVTATETDPDTADNSMAHRQRRSIGLVRPDRDHVS